MGSRSTLVMTLSDGAVGRLLNDGCAVVIASGSWLQTWGLVDALGEARKAGLEETEPLSNDSDVLALAVARLASPLGVHTSRSEPNLQLQPALGTPCSSWRVWAHLGRSYYTPTTCCGCSLRANCFQQCRVMSHANLLQAWSMHFVQITSSCPFLMSSTTRCIFLFLQVPNMEPLLLSSEPQVLFVEVCTLEVLTRFCIVNVKFFFSPFFLNTLGRCL